MKDDSTGSEPAGSRGEPGWLGALTSIPTAAGREQRVIHWIERWVAQREHLALRRDEIGNLVIERREASAEKRPLFITAHLDHPAFVVERIVAPSVVSAGFRGGVADPYFRDARVVVFTKSDEAIRGTVTEKSPGDPFPECLIELDAATDEIAIGDIARWDLPDPRIEDGMLHTHACDDLAAVGAALETMDALGEEEADHVRLLFTRAEEVGFVGAIGACKLRTMPERARVIALENSRSFPSDSPIGAGPIVRVGDRLSTFSPALTTMVARAAARLAGEADRAPGTPSVSGDPTAGAAPTFQWQRKLMAGGACEATAFCTYGYEATCVCLPLGNYHNMANLSAVQAGDQAAIDRASPGPEHISLRDYRGMIDLLAECGRKLEPEQSVSRRLDDLYEKRSFVLGDGAAR